MTRIRKPVEREQKSIRDPPFQTVALPVTRAPKWIRVVIVPNADRAVVDIRKLRDYVLNATHERGRHKARVFGSIFHLTAADAESFRDYLLRIVRTHDAQLYAKLNYGQLYRMDLPLIWNQISADVRIIWIVRENEDFPRFVSCFVRRKRR